LQCTEKGAHVHAGNDVRYQASVSLQHLQAAEEGTRVHHRQEADEEEAYKEEADQEEAEQADSRQASVSLRHLQAAEEGTRVHHLIHKN
jgi:uncharacterized protein YaiL (DUF2058 family)